MVYGIGTDIVHIPRLARALARFPRLRRRCFTDEEIAYCESRRHPVQHYAARFAAKEAVAKALGRAVAWREIAVDAGRRGRPELILSGDTRAWATGGTVSISLSHDGEYAVAFAVWHRELP